MQRPGGLAGPGALRIALREIRGNLSNPRKHFDEAELAELADSIRQHGLLQPILVRPLTAEEKRGRRQKYQIVIGSRRYYAAEQAGLTEIDCYVRGLSPEDAEIASFLDHAHHRTLTPGEEREFLRELRDRRKLRLREIAGILGKSISYVSRRLSVSGHEGLDQAVREGRISQAAAQEILAAPEEWWERLVTHAEGRTADQVRALVGELVAEGLTVEALHRALATQRVRSARPAPTTPVPAPATPAPATPAQDPALRQHGPVTVVPASRAFELLRRVHAWSATLPESWAPAPADLELLDQAVELIRAAAARADQVGEPGRVASAGHVSDAGRGRPVDAPAGRKRHRG
jgi:ParB/RepB/Spo0J family partition protein